MKQLDFFTDILDVPIPGDARCYIQKLELGGQPAYYVLLRRHSLAPSRLMIAVRIEPQDIEYGVSKMVFRRLTLAVERTNNISAWDTQEQQHVLHDEYQRICNGFGKRVKAGWYGGS